MDSVAERLARALSDRYRIEGELGEGGMATVYLAHDLRHDRKVALKVLRPELAAVVGAERFLAEIRTTANLQHPGILPLYDSGEADRLLYYVMPYVEGETLRDRLDGEKQLSVDEAVRIATAVAHALDFAHQRGVVHRDIKPGNILFQGGQPVVADFGIALAVGAGSGARLTETGLSVGTPYYMSPEQATGDQRVGPRSDIYALGCILHEMLAGDPPYTGSTAQAVLGQIITGEAPSVRRKRPSVPAHVDAVIRRSLEKLPADRFDTAKAFAEALGNPGFTHGAEAAASVGGRAPWYRHAPTLTLAVLALGLAAALVVVAARGRGRRGAGDTNPLISFALFADPAVHVDAYTTRPFAVSPDGRTVVFRASTDTTPPRLWVRRLGDARPHPLAGTESAMNPAISPDGAWVAFIGDGYLIRKVRLDGGDVSTVVGQRVTSAALDWLSDHEILFEDLGAASEGIRRVDVLGGASATAVPLDSAAGEIRQRQPFALREAGVVVYESVVLDDDAPTLAAYRLADGRRAHLGLPGVGALAFVDGRLIYSMADGTLMAVPFDASAMRLTGTPVELPPRVASNGGIGTAVGMSESGTLVYRAAGASVAARLEFVDTTGQTVSERGSLNVISPPRFSPDGRRIALLDGGASGSAGYLATGDLWVVGTGTGVSTRLTTDASIGDFAWFPDGRRIAFLTVAGQNSAAGQKSQLRSVGVDGSEPTSSLGSLDNLGAYLDVTPDGRAVVVAGFGPDGPTFLRRWIDGTSRVDSLLPRPDRSGGVIATYPRVSPDGRWVAFVDNWTSEVWVRSLDGATLQQVSESGTNQTPVVWGPDGRHLYYVGTAGLVDIELQTTPTLAVLRRHTLTGVLSGARLYDLSSDGETFVVARTPSRADDVIVTVGWLGEARKAWQSADPR